MLPAMSELLRARAGLISILVGWIPENLAVSIPVRESKISRER